MQDKLKRREILLRRVLYIRAVVYIVTLLYVFYHNYTVRDINALGVTFVAVLTPLVVPITPKPSHFKSVYKTYIVSTVLTYFVSLTGDSYHWYSYPGLDKVPHFFSSRFTAVLAVILYFYLEKTNELPDKKDYHVLLVFINTVNIAVGGIWGFYEYAILALFNSDCINHYPQGVHDMIIDVLYATAVEILLTLLIMYYHKAGKGDFFTNVYEKLYERNIARKQIGSDNIRLTGVYCTADMVTKDGSGRRLPFFSAAIWEMPDEKELHSIRAPCIIE